MADPIVEARVPPDDMRYPVNWRRRDAALFAILAVLAVTTAQLARFFPGRTLQARRKKASKWLCRQRKRGRVRVVGVVQRRETGRPELCYSRRRDVKITEIEHEVRITDFALHYHGHPFAREVKVGQTTADGLLTIDGRTCWVEIDNSEQMERKAIVDKWSRYPRDLAGYILVVCRTESRFERLRKWSEAVKDVALFTTFERLRAGQPWVDWYGNTVEI